MRTRHLCALVLPILLIGCDEEDNSAAPEAINQAWHRTDQSVKETETARNDLRHISRLREIDRLRYQAESVELTEQLQTMRGITVATTICLLSAMLWLAQEIRRRRILTAILLRAHSTGPEPENCAHSTSDLLTAADFAECQSDSDLAIAE